MIEMPFSAPVTFVPGVTEPGAPNIDAVWLLMRETRLLISEADGSLPHAQSMSTPPLRSLYLGRLGDRPVYAVDYPADATAPSGWRWSELRPLFGKLDASLFSLAGRAAQIIEWDRNHVYCGHCGKPTRAREQERSRECPACGLTMYPRLAPAVMALIQREPDKILLARSPRFPPGMWSALAGFAEPGETLEQCLEREVFEEVGLKVKNLRYFASQPWPFPHSLMIAYFCEFAGGEIQSDPAEIEAAQWFTIDGLPQLPQPISIARRLIDAGVAEMMARTR